MSFRITGLSPASFTHLFGKSTPELAALGVERHRVDASVGFPDRIELRDAAVGESVLLLNYVHQSAATPYRASHAIFVREGAVEQCDCLNEVPDVLGRRTISLRAWNAAGAMVDAELAEGRDLAPVIERMLDRPGVSYLHAHFAKRGCYAALVERI